MTDTTEAMGLAVLIRKPNACPGVKTGVRRSIFLIMPVHRTVSPRFTYEYLLALFLAEGSSWQNRYNDQAIKFWITVSAFARLSDKINKLYVFLLFGSCAKAEKDVSVNLFIVSLFSPFSFRKHFSETGKIFMKQKRIHGPTLKYRPSN